MCTVSDVFSAVHICHRIWNDYFSGQLREMHCYGLDLFWYGCNEIKILGPEIVDYMDPGVHFWSSPQCLIHMPH